MMLDDMDYTAIDLGRYSRSVCGAGMAVSLPLLGASLARQKDWAANTRFSC